MFSTAVKLANLDDYIESSQDCVVSLISDNTSKPKFEVMISSKKESNKLSSLENSLNSTEKAIVNVADCLACSGCVTTAEAKLLESQSVSKFMEEMKNAKLKIVSISNQSCAAFATYLDSDVLTVQKKLSGLFKKIGVDFVMNLTISEYVSLLGIKEEFFSRISNNVNLPMIISHCPGWICYAEKTLDPSVINLLSKMRSAQQIQGILIKTLTVEIYNQLLILYKWRLINNIYNFNKAKNKFIRNSYIDPSEVLHVAIMPCHDKKLESTRTFFSVKTKNNQQNISEVDIVLSTSEIQEIIKIAGFNSLEEVPEEAIDNLWLNQKFLNTNFNSPSLFIYNNSINHELTSNLWLIPSYYNSNSGGFCEYIIRSTVNELFNLNIDQKEKLPFVKSKNDIMEAKYKDITHEINYNIVYGFKAIQSIIRKLNLCKKDNLSNAQKSSSNNSEIHLIEIMACPSGCTSGGGQLLNFEDKQNLNEVESFKNNKKLTESIERKLYEGINLNAKREIITPDKIPIVDLLYKYLKHIDPKIRAENKFDLPFLRNDFDSVNYLQKPSLKW